MSMYDVKEDSYKETTNEMDERAALAIRKTWENISGDWMDLFGKSSISRKEMLEGVLDANRIENYGGDVEAATYIYWVDKFRPKEFKKFCTIYLSRRYY